MPMTALQTTGWVCLGPDPNCAAATTTSSTPSPQRDFYSMAAFFRNTKQTGFDKNIRESRSVQSRAAEHG